MQVTPEPAEILPFGAAGTDPADPPLVLLEEIGRNGSETACGRWPEKFRLQDSAGRLVMGRCHATNLCSYCARLGAVENTELLALDAAYGVAPVVWLTLGTGTEEIGSRPFYGARRRLIEELRRAFPQRRIEWAALVEFTTGYSAQSGGRRFPHWNVLLKGVTEDDIPTIRALVDRVWCGRADFKAAPDAQHVGTIYASGGLMKYLALHFQKESQAPPAGWSGHRFLKSRRYLWLDTPTARRHARRSLQFKRELHKARLSGFTGQQADAAATRALHEADALSWELVRLSPVPTDFDAAGLPSAWEDLVVPV